MIATGSKPMNGDYYKGLTLSVLLYGLLALVSILMPIY